MDMDYLVRCKVVVEDSLEWEASCASACRYTAKLGLCNFAPCFLCVADSVITASFDYDIVQFEKIDVFACELGLDFQFGSSLIMEGLEFLKEFDRLRRFWDRGFALGSHC